MTSDPRTTERDAGLAAFAQAARFFGLSEETIALWVKQGRLVEVLPGLLDLEDCAGRIHRAAKGGTDRA